jgi:hypothetical protein
MPSADKISTERKAGKISTEERATLRHLVREQADALRRLRAIGEIYMAAEHQALQEYHLASERLRAYREELGNG